MAVGKNKRLSKGKKGSKKKVVDPFTKKEWYYVKAPSMFTVKDVGQTPVTKTIGTKIAADSLKGRVFEVSLADLQDDEERAYRKVRLRVEDVQGNNCLTNFHGMTFTTDKLRSLVRKWQTLIEAVMEVKTQDGYTMRLFCIAFTRRAHGQFRKTSYAQSSQIKEIRRKMFEIMLREASSCDLKELVAKFIPEGIGAKIESDCQSIFPLQNVFVWKAKIVKYPKFDLTKLMDVHESYAEDTGEAMARMEEEEIVEESAPVEREQWGDT